ncbi:MAG: MATE family efflux transporter, partial [Helicobacter sp.]|nr:MATE family efflux transporter [Helicobacter sp.]
YLFIVLWSLPFFLCKIVIAAAMTANNDAITPFRIKTLAVGLHVILNSLLIAGNLGFPALGLMGAAVANLVVNILESLLIFGALWRSKKPLRLCLCFERNLTLQAFRIGIPSGLERFSTFCSMTIISSFIAGYGESVFAGYLIGGRIEAFVYMPAFGFMVAAMSLMGQNLGAHKIYEAKRCTYLTLALAMSFMGALGIVLILFPIAISRPFSLDDSVLQSSSLYLFYIGFSQVFFAMNMVLDGALRGAGATKITLLVNGLSIWILRIIPASLIVFWGGDVWLIYLLMSVETMLRALVFWTLFQKGVWHRRTL